MNLKTSTGTSKMNDSEKESKPDPKEDKIKFLAVLFLKNIKLN